MGHPATRSGIEFVIAAAFTVLTLAGCGGEAPELEEDMAADAPEDAADGPNPHVNAADLCALVPLADVAQAAGGTGTRTETGARAPASCRYFFDTTDPSSRQASATVQMLEGYSLERTGHGDRAIDVTGVGDEAWAVSHTDSYILYTRRGPLTFSVNVGGGNSDRWPDMARAVAGEVFEHL
jgi:hypothetical protein